MEPQVKIFRGKEVRLCELKSLISGGLHSIGLLLAAVGAICLIVPAAIRGANALRTASYIIYSLGMISLYGASTLYHTFYISDRVHGVLRKLDHIMIFFLIAGTYTPLCLITLHGTIGWILFGFVWVISIAGVFMKIFWISAPRWLSALVYVLLGWMIAFATMPMAKILSVGGMTLLFSGGIFYTVGALLYAGKKELFQSDKFGNHELFHVFVLLGSLCHYLLIFRYV